MAIDTRHLHPGREPQGLGNAGNARALRRLKGHPETRDIPIIFLTALTEAVDKVRGLELGAVADRLKRLVAAGGVSANQQLRRRLVELEEEGVKVFYPRLEFCTDNDRGSSVRAAGANEQSNTTSSQAGRRIGFTTGSSIFERGSIHKSNLPAGTGESTFPGIDVNWQPNLVQDSQST